ncbi:MAG: hypothetical protein K0R57_5926 [Paenibacillaceae bacterium]|nr:hypothetical protein [Paenibacillaceae bacterium]
MGAGVPGTASTATGIIDYCPNLDWSDEPAGSYFAEFLGREVKLIQDSRAAAAAEMLYGAGREFSDILCVTIGTGIGSGIISQRKLLNGGMNTAGELGHMSIAKGGRPCVCGSCGCLEQYVSGTAIIQRALERFPAKIEGQPENSETVFSLAYSGDRQALELLDACMDDLAFGISNTVAILSPQAVIISGGLCEHDSLVIAPLAKKIPKYGYKSWVKKAALKILKAELGSDAPMIGAASLYKVL